MKVCIFCQREIDREGGGEVAVSDEYGTRHYCKQHYATDDARFSLDCAVHNLVEAAIAWADPTSPPYGTFRDLRLWDASGDVPVEPKRVEPKNGRDGVLRECVAAVKELVAKMNVPRP